MNYEEMDEYIQQKANKYCEKEKERSTLMKISGVEPLVYKAYKNGYYESKKEHGWHDLRVNPNDLPLMIKDERKIKIIKNKNATSSQEVLFWGTEKECKEYINSLRSK